MLRLTRALRAHWGPWRRHYKEAPGWAERTALCALAMAVWALFTDPAWVCLTALAVAYAYAVTQVILSIQHYRRSLAGPAPGRHTVHDRKDIWKDRRPW